MGGSGSGMWYRWDKQTTLEEIRRIDISYMNKNGFLNPGTSGTLSWTRGGEPSGYIYYQSHPNWLILNYHIQQNGNDWEKVAETIYFDSTPCNFGGSRKWFICPRCSKRVRVLAGYGKYFYCRKCYELPYGSQREGKIDRLIRARDKIGKRIFENECKYLKRKGMHQRTFDRLYQKYCWLDNKIDEVAYLKFGAYLEQHHIKF